MADRKDPAKKKCSQAARADKFACYQKAVQSPEADVDFFEQAYREAYGCAPKILREDFCGTFSVSCDWVSAKRTRKAIGVDLCAETLDWGRENNLAKLTPAQQRRLTLREGDVRSFPKDKADIIAAQNFSYWIFKTREALLGYFKAARRHLNDKGILALDVMGGAELQKEGFTRRRDGAAGKRGFEYHWEQARFNPVNNHCFFYIHFKFADGSMIKRAFEYHWRLWSIAELRELLAEAGFSKSLAYWPVIDENGEETGEWAPRDEPPSASRWLSFLVAMK